MEEETSREGRRDWAELLPREAGTAMDGRMDKEAADEVETLTATWAGADKREVDWTEGGGRGGGGGSEGEQATAKAAAVSVSSIVGKRVGRCEAERREERGDEDEGGGGVTADIC